MPDGVPILMLAGALAIVAASLWNGKSVAAQVAALIGAGSRRRAIFGWAAGTAVAFGASSVVALALLGRLDAIAAFPDELAVIAWGLGLPGHADMTAIVDGALYMGAGAVLGIVILAVRRWRGRPPIGLRYRSPAAMRDRGDLVPAFALALAAGVGEELFFRLLLPLLFVLVFGWGVQAFVAALALFVLLHRHQGRVGMVAVGLLGAVLTALYLDTGALWVVIVLHVLIDVNALVLRPVLAGRGPTAA